MLLGRWQEEEAACCCRSCSSGLPESAKRAFFRDNFIDLMGAGLDPALHDLPQSQAA